MRSIITSLSFLLIIILLLISLVICSINKYDNSLKKCINIDKILRVNVDNDLLEEQNYYNLTYSYVDNYLDYILDEEEYNDIYINSSIYKRIKVSKQNIILIRNIKHIITNRSIFFLIRSFILLCVIIIIVFNYNISKGFFYFGKGLIFSGVIGFIILSIFFNIYNKYNNVYINLFNKEFLKIYFKYSIRFIYIGFVIWVYYYIRKSKL